MPIGLVKWYQWPSIVNNFYVKSIYVAIHLWVVRACELLPYSHIIAYFPTTELRKDEPMSPKNFSGGPNLNIYSPIISLSSVRAESSPIGTGHTKRMNKSSITAVFVILFPNTVYNSSTSIETTFNLRNRLHLIITVCLIGWSSLLSEDCTKFITLFDIYELIPFHNNQNSNYCSVLSTNTCPFYHDPNYY